VSDEVRYRRRRQSPRFCAFCVNKETSISYKQPEALRRYTFGRGKIRPRRQTGLCAKHQRELATAIKRARHLALLSFTGDEQ
jgi:small subunit ribosomal protein S18